MNIFIIQLINHRYEKIINFNDKRLELQNIMEINL